MTCRPLPSGKKRTRSTWLGRLLFALYLLVLLEIAGRFYWYATDRVPILQPARVIDHYYPSLGELVCQTNPVRNDDERFDVLLLGGSVINEDFGDIGPKLERHLSDLTSIPTRVWNLGQSGQTTRDSLFKYQSLHEHRFDLVLVYHGINDLRMNNCPSKLFRDDYTHCRWYREVDFLRSQPVNHYLTLPFISYRLALKGWERLPGTSLVSMHVPKPEWVGHGESIKTERTFRENLTAIIQLAHERGDALALATFALYIPDDYAPSRFKNKQLDYTQHRSAVEIWGDPKNVKRGVDTHNNVIRELARRNHLPCVEMASAIPHDRYHFNDCCHLTDEGCRKFVDVVLATLGESPMKLGRHAKPIGTTR